MRRCPFCITSGKRLPEVFSYLWIVSWLSSLVLLSAGSLYGQQKTAIPRLP